MTDLAEFLLARIAEDEAAARTCTAVYPPPWEASDRGWVAYVKADAPHFREVARLEQDHIAREDKPEWLGDAIAHIARWDPARVLAECEAKRRIVANHQHEMVTQGCDCEMHGGVRSFMDCDVCVEASRYDDRGGWCTTLRLLALPCAGHPDYHEEWRP